MKPRAERSRYLDLFQVAILPFSYTGSWQVKIEMEESTFVMGGGVKVKFNVCVCVSRSGLLPKMTEISYRKLLYFTIGV